MPDELKDTQTLRQVVQETQRFENRTYKGRRDQTVTTEQYHKRGEEFFRAMYRETADNVQALLDEIYPDMGRSYI